MCTLIHTVKLGETLTQISTDYRTPLSAIIRANPSINTNVIYPGQSIVIPGFPPIHTIPYRIEVLRNNRWLRLLKNGVLQKQYPIAVGRILHNTPTGNLLSLIKHLTQGGPLVQCG